jgi:hypothetical protein
MIYKLTSLKWWFTGVDPVKQFGMLPTMIWAVPILCALIYFFPFEFFGVKRMWNCVPLTWFIQCCPPVVLLVGFCIAVWHFVFHNRLPW